MGFKPPHNNKKKCHLGTIRHFCRTPLLLLLWFLCRASSWRTPLFISHICWLCCLLSKDCGTKAIGNNRSPLLWWLHYYMWVLLWKLYIHYWHWALFSFSFVFFLFYWYKHLFLKQNTEQILDKKEKILLQYLILGGEPRHFSSFLQAHCFQCLGCEDSQQVTTPVKTKKLFSWACLCICVCARGEGFAVWIYVVLGGGGKLGCK